MLALDGIWLTIWCPGLSPALGQLLAHNPNLPVAALFYLLYVVGIVAFGILPAIGSGSWLQALGAGALLGVVAYGTYDFTNLSTLRDWPRTLSLIDVCRESPSPPLRPSRATASPLGSLRTPRK